MFLELNKSEEKTRKGELTPSIERAGI